MTTTDLVTIILTVVLVIITGIYAWRTFAISNATKKQANASLKMAGEMKEQRYAALRPVIDIQKEVGSGLNVAREEMAALKGQLPPALPCELMNIGPGPAIDGYSFIENPIGKRTRWDFGTLTAAHEMLPPTTLLFIEPKDGRGFLVAYYKDVYDRSFESSREVTVTKEKHRLEIGPLRVRKLSNAEATK